MSKDNQTGTTSGIELDKPSTDAEHTATDERDGKAIRGPEQRGTGDPPVSDDKVPDHD